MSVLDHRSPNLKSEYRLSGDSRHHFNDGERISFVEYINKHVTLSQPINAESPVHLFEVVSEGIVLNKLINRTFPNTINEKKLVTKPNKSAFEKNINNEQTIQAAKELGCSIVNIGPDDISNGTPHLILGLLWQIIKKALLKNVTAATDDLISQLMELQGTDAEVIEENMTPEQAILHWVNYHLKKANCMRHVKNFTTDITDSESYAILMRRIAPDKVHPDDVKDILAEKDVLKRGELLIEVARRVVGENEAVFVTPQDIISGNPRLNLAFALTLFNTHPNLEVKDPNRTPSRRKLRIVQKESSKANGIWIIGKDLALYKSGSVSWDHKAGLLALKVESNEVKLKREELQVINVQLWDFGFLVSAKSTARLGTVELQDRTVYLNELETEDKAKQLAEFLESCRRYNKNSSAAVSASATSVDER